ncbi:MAG: hypothetical protein PHD82_16875 [Candidatus Riflebacteria bacterium]|jgi:hypothetical protein|nr:hypothetical protein [Candidatus Riflebacteria bacterium]
MKVCKKILHLLSIFVFLVPPVVVGVEFKQVDFERLLNKHPLMKKFDPETGRFNGTPCEIIPVELIRQRVASLTAMIGLCERKKSDLVVAAMVDGAKVDENAIWAQIGKIDHEISDIRKKLDGEEALLEQKGIPGLETLFSVVTGLTRDLIDSISAADNIVINKLPRFRSKPPQLAGFDLRHFFYQPDPQHLKKYLEQAGLIGLMFSGSDNPIIYRHTAEKR